MKYFLLTAFIFTLVSCSTTSTDKAKETPEAASIDQYESAREISAIAMAELMKSVKMALDKGGPAYAIEHCNLHASPLADSISKEYNCKIERVSLKNRSLKNAPNGPEETQLLNAYLDASVEAKPMRDTIVEMDGHTVYYRPILLGMELCLTCHGKPDEIDDETLTAIYTLYPNDKAVNYRLGDFRGAWRITFN